MIQVRYTRFVFRPGGFMPSIWVAVRKRLYTYMLLGMGERRFGGNRMGFHFSIHI
jgi:hypothetical protein